MTTTQKRPPDPDGTDADGTDGTDADGTDADGTDPPATSIANRRAELGRRGEDLAAEHLTARGYTVLARNWRCRGGELDLLVTDGGRLVVVEVKARSGTGFGLPAEAVTPAKALRIRRLAQVWLAERRVRWCEVRFDVVAVLLQPGEAPRLEHYEGAF